MVEIGFMPNPKEKREGHLERQVVNLAEARGHDHEDHGHDHGHTHGPKAGPDSRFRQCPKCGQASLIKQEGCDSCLSCAYSKCG
jgi:ribonucleoside-diphosphate reductase alpha chain